MANIFPNLDRFATKVTRFNQGVYRNYEGFRQEQQVDSRNRIRPPTRTPITFMECTIQPSTQNELLVLDEGLRDKNVFTMYTKTEIRSVVEGTNQLPDIVVIDSIEYTVIKSMPWNNNIINHYKALLVKPST